MSTEEKRIRSIAALLVRETYNAEVATGLWVQSTEYTECQASYPAVPIGSPHPLTRKRVLVPPPPGPMG